MTDKTASPPGPDDEPIDAQFEPAPDPAPAPKGPGGPGWPGVTLAAAIAALLGAGGGMLGAGLGRDGPPAGNPVAVQFAALAERQEALEQRLSQTAPAAPELAGLIRELDEASRRLDEAMGEGTAFADLRAISDRLDALERAEAGETAQTDAIRALEVRLSALETRLAEAVARLPGPEALRRAEAAQALAAIDRAARRGEGFESDYRALRAAAPDTESVRRLTPFIGGVPTLSALQASFTAMRADALQAHANAAASQTQLSWLNRVFGDAVTVRPADSGDDPVSAALDRASRQLSAGDLAGAVTALSALTGPAADVAGGWTREANRRITLDAALEAVRLSLIEPEN
ncbi:COG4223 family protein [Hyphomonas sp.]|uniref:COG4223 family protein n=1 Tax=Hyphomonas sp. TaxID=87 RepID=UPI00391B301E